MFFRRRTAQDGTASGIHGQRNDADGSVEENNSHDRYTKTYIEILNVYRDYIKKSVNNKSILKICFFVLVCGIMAVMIYLFFYSIQYSFNIFSDMVEKQHQSSSVVTGSVTSVVSSLVTMTTSILVLPKIVANYLFNKKEDRSMMKIIENIQEYEIKAVELERVKSETASTLQTGNSERNMEPAENGIPSDSHDSSTIQESALQAADTCAVPVVTNTVSGLENSGTSN